MHTIINNKSEVLFEMQITVPSNNYTLPTFQISGNANKVLYIDWGDSTQTNHIFNGGTQSLIKTYSISGTYTCKITGDLNNWTKIYNWNFNCYFYLHDLPKNITTIYVNTLNRLRGTIKDLRSNLIEYYNLYGGETIKGDLADLTSKTIDVFYSSGIFTYTSKNWSTYTFYLIYLYPYTVSLTSNEIAQFIIDLSFANWKQGSRFQLPPPNNATPTPSPALTAALATLASKSVTVITA